MKQFWTGIPVFVTIVLLLTGAYLRFSGLERKTTSRTQESASVSSSTLVSASGIFIIPPGGKEVNRDMRGQRVAYYNVGDGITISASNPKKLFLINETTSPARIRGRGLSGIVSELGKRNYLRFINNGDKKEKIKTRISSY